MLKTQHTSDYLEEEKKVNEQLEEIKQAQSFPKLKRYRRYDSTDHDNKIISEKKNIINGNYSGEDAIQSLSMSSTDIDGIRYTV